MKKTTVTISGQKCPAYYSYGKATIKFNGFTFEASQPEPGALVYIALKENGKTIADAMGADITLVMLDVFKQYQEEISKNNP